MPQLHYLYEQQGTGRERFVYYCSRCTCVLNVRRDFGPAKDATESARHCLGCGRPLEGNIECRFAPIPAEWSDSYLRPTPTAKEPAPLFLPASSLLHFSLGCPRLDSMLRPLSPDRLVVVSGVTSSTVAELAAFRAQLPVEAGGLDSAVLFVDGCNRSDLYLFSSFAKQFRLDPAASMRRVTTCRVFTLYQLADLVSQHLTEAVEDYGTRLVVLSDLLGAFNEPELEEREARRLLSAIEEGIQRAKKNAIVFVTLASPNRYDGIVVSWADTLVHLSSSRGVVRAELLKHRNRPPGTANFKFSQLTRVAR
jgi:hypothetical protein